MRSPLCACAHSRVTDASCAILHRPAVAVETPSQSHTARHRRKSHTASTWCLSEKNEPPQKRQSRVKSERKLGREPSVSTGVLGRLVTLVIDNPYPSACSDPKPTNIIPGSHHSEAVSEFHKDRIPSTAD